jgi:hypothetical protein
MAAAMNNERRDTAEVIRLFDDAFQRHDPSVLSTWWQSTVCSKILSRRRMAYGTSDAMRASRSGRGSPPLRARISSPRRRDRDGRARDHSLALLLWGEDDEHSVRGVNLMRVQKGEIVEGLGYVKAGS